MARNTTPPGNNLAPMASSRPCCRRLPKPPPEFVGRKPQGRDLVEQSLSAIARFQPTYQCIHPGRRGGARAAATRADRELADGVDRGPLHGIPISIKDLIDIAGQPDDRRLAGAGRQHRQDRRTGRRAPARGRRDPHRQDQPSRVRARHDERGLRVRRRPPSGRSRTIGWRLQRRVGRRRRAGNGTRVDRH